MSIFHEQKNFCTKEYFTDGKNMEGMWETERYYLAQMSTKEKDGVCSQQKLNQFYEIK